MNSETKVNWWCQSLRETTGYFAVRPHARRKGKRLMPPRTPGSPFTPKRSSGATRHLRTAIATVCVGASLIAPAIATAHADSAPVHREFTKFRPRPTTTTAPTTTAPTTTASAPSTLSAYDKAVLVDAPAAYWVMRGGGGTETDQTGRGLTGAYRGGTPAVSTMPNSDPVVVFNGSSQYLQVPSKNVLSISTTGKLTFEAWIRPDVANFPSNLSGYVDWMGKCANYSPDCEWAARMYNQSTDRPSRISAYAFNPGAGLGAGAYWQQYGTSAIKAGQWHQVVGQYQIVTQPSGCSGPQIGGINIWVDGVKWNMASHLPTGCMSQYGITPTAGGSVFNIGTVALDSFFKGAIGKVAIYDSLLPESRIADHFRAMTGRSPAGSCTLSGGTCSLG
ncbi:LamG-like jellyroll fold domain-containing protein [Smaragdicoccus niigatensis]|uniref:LamG-like jellyroll fold domain-containing protein n=1 Tax=Smaragdicoccus niigatensis TaxID=359359 RepID=UPI0012DDCD8A|nr:LamG-like jellyroll fold domain-containing protein [Smaragdicoccus niigatensis]